MKGDCVDDWGQVGVEIELSDFGDAQTAIAVIGTLGGVSDRAVLKDFGRGNDVRLRTAARSALKRLPVN